MLHDRIKERLKQGGHYIRSDIIEGRYINGLNLLNHYFQEPDILELFDNSVELTRVVRINHGQILELEESLPKWVIQYLGTH